MENTELLQAMQAMMKEEIGSLREEMAELRENMDEQFTRLRKVANNADMKADKFFQRIQNLLEEGYAPVADAAWSVEEKVADYEEVKSRQGDHERAIQQHNERLTELEKKVI